MKKSLLVIVLAVFSHTASKSQYSSVWAGYPLSYELSAGFATQHAPGYFWLGYLSTVQNISTTWHINKNFCIMGAGSSNIWSAYQVFESNGCSGSLTQVLNGYGVSAIEVNGSGSMQYALAGSYDKACYFTTLDKFGNVISSMSFPFPYTPTLLSGAPTQPLIIESNIKDEFYICGYFESSMYVINVTANGTMKWSSFYDLEKKMMPKDMIMSPYHPGELVVIGETELSATDHQGFFVSINGASGGVLSTKLYGNVANDEGFGSITVGPVGNSINPAGFVIGGYTQLANTSFGPFSNLLPNSTAWVLKLDPSGNIIWSKVLSPSLGTNVGVKDIIGRLNTFNNYEYYALLNSSIGMQVLKLNEFGSPFPISAPNSLYNEFVYDLPALVPSKANSISYINKTGVGADVGIQMYGTASNFFGFSSSYFVSAYFNGETNCYRTLTTIQNVNEGSITLSTANAVQFGSFSPCSNFQVVAFFPGGAANYPCSGLVPSGSNERTMPAGVNIKTNEDENFSVFPNPVAGIAQVNYAVSDNSSVDIFLYSMLGQQLLHLHPEAKLAGNYSENLDLPSLNIESGVYFVNTVVDGKLHKQKIIYTK